MPVLGALFEHVEVAYLMSWAGFLYDLTIPLWLSSRRTRLPAYVVLIGFHTTTSLLFPIGMFPAIMTTAALVFFEPSWPRTLLARFGARVRSIELPVLAVPPRAGLHRVAALGLAAWCAFHVLMPLRTHLCGGNVLWHEQGMRWSWRVMPRESNGSVSYRVRARGWARERQIAPARYLTAPQEREFGTQPDMILRLAHHIRAELEARGLEDVEVRADALVSLNGRPMARLIDPDADLGRIDDSILPASWILPAPEGVPPGVPPTLFAGALP
jgi:hypothetical protein